MKFGRREICEEKKREKYQRWICWVLKTLGCGGLDWRLHNTVCLGERCCSRRVGSRSQPEKIRIVSKQDNRKRALNGCACASILYSVWNILARVSRPAQDHDRVLCVVSVRAAWTVHLHLTRNPVFLVLCRCEAGPFAPPTMNYHGLDDKKPRLLFVLPAGVEPPKETVSPMPGRRVGTETRE